MKSIALWLISSAKPETSLAGVVVGETTLAEAERLFGKAHTSKIVLEYIFATFKQLRDAHGKVTAITIWEDEHPQVAALLKSVDALCTELFQDRYYGEFRFLVSDQQELPGKGLCSVNP